MLRLFVITLALTVASPSSVDPVPGYHNFSSLTQALREAVGANPSLARMVSIGKSAEGRDIWMIEIGSGDDAARATRPGLLIAANLEGDRLVGSELALEIISYLLENSSDADVRARLDDSVFYIIPRANPDGAERMFASSSAPQFGGAGNTKPFDDDNDGRTDEDGPEDLNGDGIISFMRVLDPTGELALDSADVRVLKKADPTKRESGQYKVYWEGVDSDNDGFFNEDAISGVNLNRNFQHEYPYYTRGAGPHMISEPESRAIMDFVIGHRNIASVLVFGAHDNLITPPDNKGELAAAKPLLMSGFANESLADARTVGVFEQPRQGFFGFGGGQQREVTGRPSSGRRPATTVDADDRAYFKAVSDEFKKLTGIADLPGTDKPEGALFEYAYYQFGVPAFSTPGWGLPKAESAGRDSSETGAETGAEGRRPSGAAGRAGGGRGESEASTDVRLLKWMDEAGIDGFVPWTSLEHATLGAVEVGGFKPFEYLNPPHETVVELGAKHGEFAVYLASQFARVRIAKTEVTDHGGGVFRIKAEVENAGYFPTSTAQGVTSRSVKPTMVQLGIDPDALLSGDAKTSFFQALDGSGTRETFEWVIRGRRGDTVELKAVAQKGGTDTAEITLR